MAVVSCQSYPAIALLIIHLPTDSSTTVAMDAATPTCFAYSFVVPNNPFGGTLKFNGFRWYCSAASGSPSVTAYLLADVNGVPDVLASAIATGNAIAVSASSWVNQTFASSTAITAGTQYWVALKTTAGTSATISYQTANVAYSTTTSSIVGGSGAVSWRALGDSGTGAAWGGTDRATIVGVRVLLTDDTDTAYVGWPTQAATAAVTTYKADGSTEPGVCFTLPSNISVDVRTVILPVRKFLTTGPGAASVKLYTGDSTTATATSNAVPAANILASNNEIHFDFATPITLVGGTKYRLVLSAASGDASNYYVLFGTTWDSDSCTGGTVDLVPCSTAYTRLNSGSWDGGGSPTYTTVPGFGLITDKGSEFNSTGGGSGAGSTYQMWRGGN